jgi:hypothetical protein
MRVTRLLSLLGVIPLGSAILFLLPPEGVDVPIWYYSIIAAVIIVGILQIVLPQLTLASTLSQRIVHVLGAITTFICCLMLGLVVLGLIIGGGNW